MDYKASNKIKDVEMCHLLSLSFNLSNILISCAVKTLDLMFCLKVRREEMLFIFQIINFFFTVAAFYIKIPGYL